MALALQGRAPVLREEAGDQIVQQRPHPTCHLVLPSAERSDLVQSELDEIVPDGRRIHEPCRSVDVSHDPADRCFAAIYGSRSSIRSSDCTAVDAPLVFSNAGAFKAFGQQILIDTAARGPLPSTLVIDFGRV
jgi:hypothetical protein